MKYKTVGKTGIQVSELCFGTMSFGGNADKETSKQLFHRCLDKGINFFDTADVYSSGAAEEILGELMEGRRDELVLTSKAGFPFGSDLNARGASRRHLFLSVEQSLKRLRTDRIEFYFIHRFDSLTSIEETVRALDDLRRQGKILYPAVSNWAAWQIAKALGISAKEGLAGFELIQPMYNLVKRQAEVEILPLAESEKLGVISYSPLGGGLLTGKYGIGKKPATGRLVDQSNYTKRYGDEAYYDIAERFAAYSREKDIHPATLAVAWVLSNPAITAPIIGARSVEQLEPSLAAVDLNFTNEWRKEVTALSIDPPIATDRSEEAYTF
ncbi:aldo/keto reductase [Paenibacillus planticolens]|uniref:Aldo/keto reductase n=1 Tax=Paenibacillus planticolens TaxID=2654976 RepID=A0ABX1ZUL6_9BACL|nr:aldo/keto reductase [Paenibacillus planticolens]NOV03736.1 aldo/keto reductase [Paenibacillus planticolens]